MRTGNCVFILCLLILMAGCDSRQDQPEAFEKLQNGSVDVINGRLIADTIIYQVIIKNRYPEDPWAEKCLHKLKRMEFVDQLFTNVYNGKASAYDYYDRVSITPEELKKMEKNPEFDRQKIGMIQFTEQWLYNEELNLMAKRVLDITLGYEFFDSNANLSGYRPAFKVVMNLSEPEF